MGLEYTKKCVGGRGAPRTLLGELTTLPSPLVGWGGDTPSPIPTSLGASGASILAPSALSFCAPNVTS